MYIPSWAILVGVFVIIAIWAGTTVAGALESMANVSTAPSLEAAAGRAAIRGTIFALGVGLVALAILAGLYAYYRRPTFRFVPDATIQLSAPAPAAVPPGPTPTPSPGPTPTVGPAATQGPPSPTSSPQTPVPQCSLSVGMLVRVVAPTGLELNGSNLADPDLQGKLFTLKKDDVGLITAGPFVRSDGVYWHYNAGGGLQGWGPEMLGGQCAVVP
ncbi:MAG: hypothetical protein U0822_06525 [Anaerolineae bacterium]